MLSMPLARFCQPANDEMGENYGGSVAGLDHLGWGVPVVGMRWVCCEANENNRGRISRKNGT